MRPLSMPELVLYVAGFRRGGERRPISGHQPGGVIVPELLSELGWFSKTLIEALPTAVYVCAMDSVVVAFNQRAVELWGRTPNLSETDEKFCGAHKLFLPNGASLPHRESPMGHVLKTGEPAVDQEVIIERPDGSRVTVLVNIKPIIAEDGSQIGAVNCFHDISRLKAAERSVV